MVTRSKPVAQLTRAINAEHSDVSGASIAARVGSGDIHQPITGYETFPDTWMLAKGIPAWVPGQISNRSTNRAEALAGCAT
jgi:hypothetical protein